MCNNPPQRSYDISVKAVLALLGGFVSACLGLITVKLYDPTQLQLITCFAGMAALAGLFILEDIHVDNLLSARGEVEGRPPT